MNKEKRELLAKTICYEFYSEGVAPAGDGMVERVAQKVAGLPFPLEPENDFLNKITTT